MTATQTRLKRQILDLLKKDEEFRYAIAGLIGLEEILKRLDRHEEEIKKLREDMNKLREDMNRGFELMERRLSAVGARWGVMAEEAFREGLRDVLEKEMGLKVERWVAFDEEGKVHGYPSTVEIDIAVKDDKLLLIEITSHAKISDVTEVRRKADLYAEKSGNKPDKIIIIAPYIEENAQKAAETLQIETYTKI